MKFLFANILCFFLMVPLITEASELWKDGKITPEQPFKAEIIGVRNAPWAGGVIIYLKETDGKERYCKAEFFSLLCKYTVVSDDDFDKPKLIAGGAYFIEPSVKVSTFSWSMGDFKIGNIFGKIDIVRINYSLKANKTLRTKH